jgi:hypothetical protein
MPVVVGPKGSEGQLFAHWWRPLSELGRDYNSGVGSFLD